MYKRIIEHVKELKVNKVLYGMRIKVKFLICNQIFFKAIFLNLLILLTVLFLFEPTPKQDDYDQTMVLYGGFTGEYSAYAQYINFFLSKAIQSLMYLFPTVSWYYIILYLFVFLSFIVITYVFIKRSESGEWIFPVSVILLFCAYELYIRFTFTKVSGIAMIAGFLFLLYLLEKREVAFSKYLVGILFILFGMIVRNSMYELVVAIFFSVFIITIIKSRKNIEKIIPLIAAFVLIVVGMYGCSKALNIIDFKIKAQNDEWSYYGEVNGSRVALQDYEMPEYGEFSVEYSSIGMSENDYDAWKKEGLYNDYAFFTPNLLQEIRNIEPVQKNVGIFQIILKSFRNLLNYYFSDTGIYIFLVSVIFLSFYLKKNRMQYLAPVCCCCIFAYIYMYYRGRLRHHVDVMILIAGAIILLFYCFPIQDNRNTNKKRCYYSISILMLIFVIVHYNKLTYSSYYEENYGSGISQYEEYNKNKENLTLLSEDRKHMYLIGSLSTDYIFNREWTIFDVVTPEFYHNMISSSQYHVPHSDKNLSTFGIKNIYQELTNSKYIYVVTVDERPTFVETLCTYIAEHYYPDVYYTKVKEIDNINIYRFTSGNVRPVWKNKEKGNVGDVISDITITEAESGEYLIEGYAYIDGIDSYAQNIYLEAKDNMTGISTYAYTLQSENELLLEKNKYHGKYSDFCGTIPNMNGVDNMQINIYIETENNVYCLELED